MNRRLLMIGLDATEPSLVERWTADGSLPILAALCRSGSYGRLASTADWLVGSPWPAFYTGLPPAETGFYHSIVWRPERMEHARATSDVFRLEPFWRALSRAGPRVIAFDVPLIQEPAPLNGIEINGWANTDLLAAPGSYPLEAIRAVDRDIARPGQEIENYKLESVESLLALRDQQVALVDSIANASTALLRREAWDLAIVALHPPHFAGHKLWDETNLAEVVPARRKDELGGALRDVYAACDRAVGRLVEAAGGDCDVMVFSLHGMGPNTCRTDFLGEMVRRIMGGTRPARAVRDRAAAALRSLLPQDLRFAVKSRMPQALRDRLTVYWRTGTRDWSRTRAFNVFSDLRGYVRLNLKDREAEGQVEPGGDADALLDEIADGLGSFVDADSGLPLVAGQTRQTELAPVGAKRHLLPDLVVRWSDMPAAQHRAMISPRFGDIPWPTPGRFPTGRSGNHRGEGFLIAKGPRLDGRIVLAGAHILDLAPTVYGLLGMPVPETMTGRCLTEGATAIR